MIPRLHGQLGSPLSSLAEALGPSISPDKPLTEQTLVAHGPGLDHHATDGKQRWTCARWVEHFAATGEQPFVIDVRLHPDDRDLSVSEWADAAHRLARGAGIEVPGDETGCRWIAVQVQPQRLVLIAAQKGHDDAPHTHPAGVPRRLAKECRRIEQDLHLLTPNNATRTPVRRSLPPPPARLTKLPTQLAVPRLAGYAEADSLNTPQRLELIVQRLRALQEDLDAAATHQAQPRVAVAPPTNRHPTRRSPEEKRPFAPCRPCPGGPPRSGLRRNPRARR